MSEIVSWDLAFPTFEDTQCRACRDAHLGNVTHGEGRERSNSEVPILFLEGVEGKLFRPMALTVVFALLGSMALSLTLMPVLSSLLLPRRVRERDNLLVRAVKAAYRPLLRLDVDAAIARQQ